MVRNSEDLIAGLVADLRPVRPLHQSWGMAFAISTLVLGCVAMVALFGARADLAGARPDGVLLISAGLFMVLALASAWGAVDMARPYVGTRREGWGWTALMAGMLPLGAVVLVALAWVQGLPIEIDADGQFCMKYGLIWGLLTAGSLVMWLRRGAPSQPARAGLLTGVAAGAAGTFAVSLYCPHNELIHIGLWHGLTVVLSGIAGRIVVPKLIQW